jgi:hypothetical protein
MFRDLVTTPGSGSGSAVVWRDPPQPIYAGIHRSDYMLDAGPDGRRTPTVLRQIEINTISAAFGGLSAAVAGTHAAVVSRFGGDASAAALPPNPCTRSIAHCLAVAHQAYLESQRGRR